MNNVINLLKNHRTYRHFDDKYELPEQELSEILACAQQAPSWMNAQDYSIIVVEGDLKNKIAAALPNQPQIKSCAKFLIFIADLNRASVASAMNHQEFAPSDPIQNLMISNVDLALAAQNAVIAAESLGYGICYIGAVRLIAKDLISWLNLPLYTYPVFGLCIGKPIVDMKIKPRLPSNSVIFTNEYKTAGMQEILKNYQQKMIEFAELRETLPWTEKLAKFYASVYASETQTLLKSQKLL